MRGGRQSSIPWAVPAVLLLLATIFATAQPSFAACTGCGGSRGDRLCGPKSLFQVCTQLGVATDLEELTRLAETDENGTTMAGLRKAAQQKGLQAVGLKISLSELARCPEPAICLLWGDHFVVARSDGAEVIAVTDPSAKEGEQGLPLEDFKASYSGFALLLSKRTIAPPGLNAPVPDLRLGEYTCDLGTLDEGGKIEKMISLRNAGEQELTISQVRATCSCIEVGQVTKSIPPGGSGSISFGYDATDQRGPQAKALYIESNDPVSPVVQVQVTAGIKPANLLASTRRIELGEVNTARGATREMYIKDPGDGSLDIREVLSDSPLVKVTLAGAAPPEYQHLGVVFPVRVTLRPGAPVGPFAASITIVSNHPKEPRLRIPVVAKIRGEVEVNPEKLFLGIVKKGQSASRSVTVSTASARKLSLTDVSASSDSFTAKVSPGDGGNEYKIIVGLSERAPTGLLRANLTLHTNSKIQPTITVPISALVEEREKTTANENPKEVGDKARPESAAASAGPVAAKIPVVRVYAFTSKGCNVCELVSRENMQAIAAKVGCRLETQYFDVDSIANWRKLTELETKRHDTGNTIPVVFIGWEVLSGEEELATELETVIAKCAAEGGTAWPDEIDHGP